MTGAASVSIDKSCRPHEGLREGPFPIKTLEESPNASKRCAFKPDRGCRDPGRQYLMESLRKLDKVLVRFASVYS